FKSLYHDYWRVETTGVEHVPATGRALLVANHAGVLPWDGTMIKTAVFVEHPHPRHVRALVASQFMGMPVMSWFLRRTGQAVGHLTPLARLFGLPYFPVTPFWPWLGPLGMIPLPSKWRIQFHPPVEVAHLPPKAAEDQHLVMTLADDVRDTIQRGIYENLKLRRGVFF